MRMRNRPSSNRPLPGRPELLQPGRLHRPLPSEHGRRILYYHDPMHPSYRSSQPGIAPDCNMQLTPVYADDSAAMPAPDGDAHQ